MVKKGRKNVLRYTARIVPKTLKATKNVSKFALKKLNSIFVSATKNIKQIAKRIDKGAARTIRSITRRKGRK
jgi:enhancing lycopene biosynthesis protein 2